MQFFDPTNMMPVPFIHLSHDTIQLRNQLVFAIKQVGSVLIMASHENEIFPLDAKRKPASHPLPHLEISSIGKILAKSAQCQ
jgi:hypothetical protein